MEFKVFSLNCWGLAFVSKNKGERMRAIAALLARSDYDVVCLQEVWLNSDYEAIKEKVAEVLPYAHYFHSGVTGSGICIFSRHQMEEVFFHQWTVNGYIHKIHHGDWFGGKGVGCCQIRVNNYVINVYSAHLHAEYDKQCDEYQAHRVLQAFDTAQFIHITSGGADFVILAGDLNTKPGDVAYKIIVNVPGLLDAFEGRDECLEGMTATFESPTNSYTPKCLLKTSKPGERIDYILYRSTKKELQADMKSYQLPLPNKIPGHGFSYSDHEAVLATFVLKKSDSEIQHDFTEKKKEVLEESIDICEDALVNLKSHKCLYWFFTFVLFILLMVVLTTNAPCGLNFLYHILRTVITLFMMYTVIMATIWNKIERHAVMSARFRMLTSLRNLKDKTF